MTHVYLTCYDMSGNLEWQEDGIRDWTFRNGIFYAACDIGYNLTASAIDAEGNRLWVTGHSIAYLTDVYEYFYLSDISLKPNGTIALLVQAYRMANEYQLIQFSPTGELLKTNTIESVSTGWSHYGQLAITMLYSPSGVLYTGHTNIAGESLDIGLEAFGNLPVLGGGIELIIIVGGLAAGVIVLTFIWYKRRGI
ncbi:MAG: hypothetical protein RTU92_04225 [Candidatus Thorarchaeota archaeon]